MCDIYICPSCGSTRGRTSDGRCGSCGGFPEIVTPRTTSPINLSPAPLLPRGWVCPQCSTVMSPYVHVCLRCSPTTTTTGSGTLSTSPDVQYFMDT